MFVSLRRTQTWRLHAELYKFGWHASANSAQMKQQRPDFLAKLFILQLSIISQILEFSYWMVMILILITWLVKTENKTPPFILSLTQMDSRLFFWKFVCLQPINYSILQNKKLLTIHWPWLFPQNLQEVHLSYSWYPSDLSDLDESVLGNNRQLSYIT